jgi:hypothetical protein
MLERAARRGVAVVRGSVVGIDRIGDRVEAVVIDGTDGRTRLPTTRFVNAAGPFALPLLAMAGADLEIETVLRQKAVFRDDAGVVPRAAPFTILLDGQELPWTASERLDLSKAGDARILGPLPGGSTSSPTTPPARRRSSSAGPGTRRRRPPSNARSARRRSRAWSSWALCGPSRASRSTSATRRWWRMPAASTRACRTASR